MQCGINCTLGQIERAPALPPDRIDDRIAMCVAEIERSQDYRIQVPFEHFRRHADEVTLALLGVKP